MESRAGKEEACNIHDSDERNTISDTWSIAELVMSRCDSDSRNRRGNGVGPYKPTSYRKVRDDLFEGMEAARDGGRKQIRLCSPQ